VPALRRKIVGKKISGTISSFAITTVVHYQFYGDDPSLDRSTDQLETTKGERFFGEQTLPAKLKSDLFSGSAV